MRQQQQISWDTIHSELWLRAHYQPQKLNGSNWGGQGRNRGSGVRSNFPKVFCWKFHNGTHCNGCAFKHHCFKCGNNHPIFRCQQQQSPRLGEIPQQSSHPCLKTALSTPVNVAVLSRVLLGYNSHIAYRLIKGFSEGFKINYQGPRITTSAPNLGSAYENPDIVDDKLRKERELGRIAGPFDSLPRQANSE